MPSSDSTLSALAIDKGTLTPTFASGTHSYDAGSAIYDSIETIGITATKNDSGASITINGASATSAVKATKDLALGLNTFTIRVTAADTSHTDYVLTVTRLAEGIDYAGAPYSESADKIGSYGTYGPDGDPPLSSATVFTHGVPSEGSGVAGPAT